VLRPSLFNSASRRAIGRNLGLDLIAAIGIGVTMALVGAILPTVARRDGLDPIGLSALAAAPFVANLLGAFAGKLGPRNRAQLSLVRILGSASLLVLFLAPSAGVVVIVSIVFWLSLSFGNPLHFRFWGSMYPGRLRGRVVGVLGMGRSGAGALAAIGGGVLADVIGGDQAVAVAGVIGVFAALGYLGFRAATTDAPTTFSARQSIAALREQPRLVRLTIAQLFYGGGVIAAMPLFALVHVDRLHLSLADVGLIGVIGAVATTVTFPVWGLVADRRGAVVALAGGSLLGTIGVVAYAVAPNVAFLWLGALAMGVASGGIDLGIAQVVSEDTPMATRAAAMAGWNAITGARGIVAAFAMSVLLGAKVVDVRTALLLSAAISAIGVWLFVDAGRARVARAVSAAPVAAPTGAAAAGARLSP
jgi:MFS family permease